MSIRQKLRLSVLLLVVAFVTITGMIAYTVRSVHQETAQMAEVNRAVRMVFELSLLGYEYQTYREERGAVQWRGVHRRLDQSLAAMVGDLTLSEAQDVLRRLRDNHVLIGTLFETLAAKESTPEASRLSGQSLLLRSNVMVADAHQLAEASNRAAATRRTQTLLVIFIGSLVPLGLACGFVFVANHRILSALMALDVGATALGNGHLTHTIRVTGQDEFAALSRTMNTMAAQLHADITRRQCTEDALRESEVRFRMMAETMPIPVVIGRPSDGLILYANAAWHTLVDVLPGAPGTHKITDFLYDPAERQTIIEALRQGGSVRNYELQIKAADGTLSWVLGSFQIVMFNGEPAVLSGFYDITERKRVEEELQHSEALLHAILNNMPAVVSVKSVEGRYLLANTQFAKLHQTTSGQLIGKTAFDLIPKERAERLRAIDTQILQSRQVTHMEEAVQRADGLHTYLVQKFPLLDANGEPYAICAIYTDITERTQMEEELQRTAADLVRSNTALSQVAVIVESSTDAIISMTPDGHIVSWNAGAARLYGYASHEIHGRHISRLIPPDRASELAYVLDTIRCGTPAAPYETVHLGKDGQRLDVFISLSPLYDATGQVRGAAAIARDMSERRWAREQFHGLLEATPDAMVIVNQAGNIVLVNAQAERLFGYARQEMLGQAVELLLPARVRHAHTTHRLGYAAAPSMRLMGTGGTLYGLHKDGHEFPVEVSLAPLQTAEGLLISSVIQDVTARKQAETALAHAMEGLESQNQLLADARDQAWQATRAKSAFLASMSHEIRTPMNAILGMADLLEDTPLTPTQEDYVQRFKRAGAHLLTLINDILDLSKIEADQLELEQTPFNLDELLNEVAELMAMRAHAKGIELLCSVAPDVPIHRHGDPHRLRQILVNLLSNAIKFTDTGEVILRVLRGPEGRHPGQLRFSVHDTGIGIPAEKLAMIFESFTQVDTSTTRQYGGTDLGLTISKKLVELMDGRIWANSHLGQGSTFHATVQCALNPTPPEQVIIAPAVLTNMRVLVVDNNATNRLILHETLRAWGARVTEAHGAEDALSAWTIAAQAAQPFHLVLLDCQMPGQDGFALAAQLQQTASMRTATLFMLSSDIRRGDPARCQALGIAQLLPKPITRFLLSRALTEVFGQRAAAPPLQPPSRAATDKGLAILMAEDNEDNQMLIQSYLKATAHRLTLAENGAMAVEQFTAGHYDLVLMDMQMPVMDGYTATARMRQWEQEHTCPPTLIVALTANALTADLQKSLDAGCDGHLTKPIKKVALLAALADYTSRLATT